MNHGGHMLCSAIRGTCWVSLGKLRQGRHVTSSVTQRRDLAGLPGPRGFGEKWGTASSVELPGPDPAPGVGHIRGGTCMCSQDLPAQPCLPVCGHVCSQHRTPVPVHVTHLLRGSKDPTGTGTADSQGALGRVGALLGIVGGQGVGWGLRVSCAPGEGMECLVLR